MTPTSRVVLAVLVLVAAALPVAAVWLYRRRQSGAGGGVRDVALLAGVVVAAQGAAVIAVFGVVNREYGFYPTWGSLVGRDESAAPVAGGGFGVGAAGLRVGHSVVRGLAEPPADLGRYVQTTITGSVSHIHQRVDVWLPPQYADRRERHVRFPVVMLLSGAYSGDTTMYRKLDFARVATMAIRTGKVAPFVAVYPQLNNSLRLDTECVDIPAGIQSFTWLAHDVPVWAKSHLRVTADPRQWSAMGWSTGGYCAAKLHLLRPQQFAAAASVEGYFQAEPDQTTGNLAQVLAANPRLREESTLGWVITHHPPVRTHLLVSTSLTDPQSKPSSLAFLKVAAHDPGVQPYVVADLGHSMPAMKQLTPYVLDWLAAVAGA